jgi:hypothetical protein
MNGYYSKEVLRQENALVNGIAVAKIVSNEFRISPQGSINLRIDLVCDSVAVTTGINFILQTTSGVDKDGNEDWQDTKTTTVTVSGSYTLTFMVAKTTDQQYLPLRPKGRIVVNAAGVGDTITVESIRVMQEE